MSEIISTVGLGSLGAACAFAYISARANHKLRREQGARSAISADRAK